MTAAPQRKRWMEPGAAPYRAPSTPRSGNPGRVVGFLAVAPALGLLVTAMISGGHIGGADVVVGAVITGLLMMLIAPSATRKR
ncbi:hypothetical protein ACIBTV_25545 [Micromonospora sp. NPDC049366]|uniref:hypothetical protein n=1 Tax=Micromonospora sp. NPDC049366 TaxID=3364271 RepID=UPI0037BD22E8